MIVVLVLLVSPIAVSALEYLFGGRSVDWQTADRSSAGLLPSPAQHPEALVRIYAARTVRWRGIFAVHSWIVVKQANAPSYTRYDYTAWGEPIRIKRLCAGRALVRRRAGSDRRGRRRGGLSHDPEDPGRGGGL